MKTSSVIVLSRGTGDDVEVLWSQRNHTMAFLGGFWAFAGGAVEDGDDGLPMQPAPPEGFPAPAFYGCAAREIFEEHGLLVTTEGLRHVATDPALVPHREAVLRGEEFDGALEELGAAIDTDRFWPLARWITPEWFALRFDSEFFSIHLLPDEAVALGEVLTGDLLDGELIDAEWIRPAAALRLWHDAERFITPPIRYLLEAMIEHDDLRQIDLHADDVASTYDAWLSVDGIYLVPLESPTIPPATHTNCIIVGTDRLLVIDPGSPYDTQQELLASLLAQMIEDGKTIEAVVLTHHHPDHVGGVSALVEQFDCDVWAHPKTQALVGDAFHVDRTLSDADRIGHDDDVLRVVYTPGHASDHIALLHERTRVLLAGDLIASHGTILVNPPDGHMGSYLESIDRVRALEPHAIYPAHGWIVTNPLERLDYYASHRLEREEKVFDALVRFDAPATPMDLVPDAYVDAPKTVWPIAARSALAHLEHLVEVERAVRRGGRFVVATSPQR